MCVPLCIASLRRQVRQLKAELAQQNGHAGENMSPARRRRTWEEAGRFVLGDNDERVPFSERGRNLDQVSEETRDKQGEAHTRNNARTNVSGVERGGGTTPTGIAINGPQSEPENSATSENDEGCEEGEKEGERQGTIDSKLPRLHQNLLSKSSTLSSASSLLSSLSSPMLRVVHSPPFGSVERANEFCLALRELVWAAAAAAVETKPAARDITSSFEQNGKAEAAANVQLANTTRGVGGSSAPAIRAAIQAAVRHSNCWAGAPEKDLDSSQRTKKCKERRRQPYFKHHTAEQESAVLKEFVSGEEIGGTGSTKVETPPLPDPSKQMHARHSEDVWQSVAVENPIKKVPSYSVSRVQEEERCDDSRGLPCNLNIVEVASTTTNGGWVEGRSADDLEGAFERFKHGDGKHANSHLQVRFTHHARMLSVAVRVVSYTLQHAR